MINANDVKTETGGARNQIEAQTNPIDSGSPTSPDTKLNGVRYSDENKQLVFNNPEFGGLAQRKFWWVGSNMNGASDVNRLTISSMESPATGCGMDLHSMFDPKLIEAIEKEMLAEDEEKNNLTSADRFYFQEDGQTKKRVSEIKQLINEEEFILDNLLKMTRSMKDARKMQDLIEAVCSEIYKRKTDKLLKLDRIMCQDDQQIKQITFLEKKLRRAEIEVAAFRRLQDIKTSRQAGRYKPNPSQVPQHSTEDISQIYDWIVDIDLVTQVSNQGWKITLSPTFQTSFGHLFTTTKEISSSQSRDENNLFNFQVKEEEEVTYSSRKQQEQSSAIISTTTKTTTQNNQNSKDHLWDGALVAVVGLYDKGKTFVLNNLTLSNLPSGKKITTKGISFKHVNVDSGTNLILVDTAGSYSPVKINNELSIVEKEATEVFITDLVFDIADYFICVVNDFTSLDQRYLDKLSRDLQNSPRKTFREIIVIHNLKEVESEEILEHVWQTQVMQIYNQGCAQKTKVAALDPKTNSLQEKHVVWFKSQFTRHICLANHDSELGNHVNPWVFSLLRYWLKAVFVPVERSVPVIDQVMKFSTLQLSKYFKTGVSLQMIDTESPLVKYIRTKQESEGKLRIPQMQIDSSGIVLTRPDNFIPTVDIIANESYQIWMDVPGLSKEDISIYRQNVITVVKGTKPKPYEDDKKLDRNERRYGDFTLTFKIPEIYERKWTSFEVEKGVLKIAYLRDTEESNN